MIVYAAVDATLSADLPRGVELEVFRGREDAERFIEEPRGDELELAATCESSSGNWRCPPSVRFR